MGAPKGNRNASKENRLWRETIHRVITQNNSERLRKAAERLVAEAEAGNVRALVELGDRIDGKVPQAIVGSDGGPLQVQEVPWLNGRSLARR